DHRASAHGDDGTSDRVCAFLENTSCAVCTDTVGRMPKIVWTDSMRRRLFALRGTPSAVPITVSRDKVWAELCAAPKKIGSKARGKEQESAAKELARPKSPPDPKSMTLEHEVARATYLRVNMRYNTGGNYPRDVTPNQM